MRQFFKFLFASCLGVLLALIVVVLFCMGLGSAMGGDDSVKEVKTNSILSLKLESDIPELTDNVEKSPFEGSKTIGLRDMVISIERAANDEKIKGILIDTRFTTVGMTARRTLREAIENFKKSGKFVYAYADIYTQSAYHLASVADSIIINPSGNIEFTGLAAEIPFMKGFFDKLDVKWQVYYAGQFKSATEPFRLDKMSDQNRLQTREYLNGLYQIMLSDISKSRKVSTDDLHKIADDFQVRQASDAVRLKLADTEGYYDEALSKIRRRLGMKETDKINSISITDYAQSFSKNSGSSKDKIAVIYAEGEIGYGSNSDDAATVDGERYAKMIRKIRQDKNVKAIVLRVNSPGGSGFGSDIMLRELELARQSGKPVFTSFGDVAASGGYYIAMASDSIFAEESTITGSIGVFAMIPGLQEMLKNKLGIAFDTVKTGKFAAMNGAVINFTDGESMVLQQQVDTLYERFLGYVARNRKMTRDQVHEVAQGRVWLGGKAKQLGLVDRMGSLNDAINAAAAKANLSNYKITEYPKQRDGIQKFIEEFTGKKPTDDLANAATQTALKNELGQLYPYYQYVKSVQQMKGAQMRLPFVLPKY